MHQPRRTGCREDVTCAAMVGMELVFLEYELVVDVLYVGKVEIGLGDEQAGLWRVDLEGKGR